MTFTKGQIAWNKGKKHSENTKIKLSLIRKQPKYKLLSIANLPKDVSGKNNPFYGKKHSKESINKLSKSHIGKKFSKEVNIKKGSKGNKNGNYGKGLHGELNGRWNGGTSRLPYSIDWTETLRRSIRERDGYICQIDSCKKLQGDRAFHVHHINYDKKNCNPSNLITLCPTCHAKTNSKRSYWIELFTNKKTKKWTR